MLGNWLVALTVLMAVVSSTRGTDGRYFRIVSTGALLAMESLIILQSTPLLSVGERILHRPACFLLFGGNGSAISQRSKVEDMRRFCTPSNSAWSRGPYWDFIIYVSGISWSLARIYDGNIDVAIRKILVDCEKEAGGNSQIVYFSKVLLQIRLLLVRLQRKEVPHKILPW